MSREHLDRAYAMIKDGQAEEAISIIEAVIRADRENENAWWLLANATSDPAAQRNALNNVIRLTQNADRTNKAQAMLQALDGDPYDFGESPNVMSGQSSYQDYTPPAKQGSRGGCGKVFIGLVAIIGVCACVSIFGIYWVARPIIDAVSVPESYDDLGVIEGSFSKTDNISTTNDVDAFLYRGTAGENLLVTVDSDSEMAPFIFVYDMEIGIATTFGQAFEPNSPAELNFTVPSSGEYLIAIRGFPFMGQEIGFGDYEVNVEVRD